MTDAEIIAELKREPAAELRRLQKQPYEWKVEHALKVIREFVKNEDVVGKCFLCGRDVTAQDVRLVNAVTYTWERKDGTTIEAYHCFGSCACREPVVTTCDCTDTAFHNAYLRLTGYTEQEYREKLKRESPTVYAARVKAGIYQEA